MCQNPYFKGMLTGVVVGAVMGMLLDPIRSERDNAHLKKKACRMMKTAGRIMENLTDF